MIKFVFLDLDDTILDFKKAEKRAIDLTLHKLSVPHGEKELALYSEINKSCWERFERGELTKPEVLSTRFNILFSKLGQAIEPLVAQKIYESELAKGHYFIDGAEKLLEELSKKYRLFLVSNGTKVVQNSRIKSAEIGKYFEKIFVSEDLKANKPQKKFFDKVFSQIENFDKEQSIIIGDSLTSDIQGGINAGIKTLLFDRNGNKIREDIVPNFRVRTLMEIPSVLMSL